VPHLPVAERRTQLLAAAWRVLASQGLAAATTRTICAEAGMPQGAFHYCFDSRDELLREVATGLLPDEITAAVAVIDRSGTLAACLERALQAYWELVEADLGAHQVLYEITTAALRDPAGRDIAEQQYARYLQGARQVLERIAEVRRIQWRRPVEVLARQVVTVVDGLTLHYAVDHARAAARAALSAFAQDLAAVGKRGAPGVSGDQKSMKTTAPRPRPIARPRRERAGAAPVVEGIARP
jgi:AcrR family transcriptional regulator